MIRNYDPYSASDLRRWCKGHLGLVKIAPGVHWCPNCGAIRRGEGVNTYWTTPKSTVKIMLEDQEGRWL